ncbi:hypothetical protein QTP88_012908 [Uroleucon formosanum]
MYDYRKKQLLGKYIVEKSHNIKVIETFVMIEIFKEYHVLNISRVISKMRAYINIASEENQYRKCLDAHSDDSCCV